MEVAPGLVGQFWLAGERHRLLMVLRVRPFEDQPVVIGSSDSSMGLFSGSGRVAGRSSPRGRGGRRARRASGLAKPKAICGEQAEHPPAHPSSV